MDMEQDHPQRRAFDRPQVSAVYADPRRAQLLALFDKSDDRGQDLLLKIAGIHASHYPRVK